MIELKSFMNKYAVLTGIICASLVLFSCEKENKEVKNDGKLKFFQASEFILKDYRQARKSRSLFKLVEINGTLDSIIIKDTIGPSELVLLDKLNIDNPKLKDKYNADTVFGVYGDPDKLTYTAKEEKLSVQQLDIFLNQGKVTTIKAHSRLSSLINHHEQYMTYYPQTGYEITSTQKMWSGDTIRMFVKASFR